MSNGLPWGAARVAHPSGSIANLFLNRAAKIGKPVPVRNPKAAKIIWCQNSRAADSRFHHNDPGLHNDRNRNPQPLIHNSNLRSQRNYWSARC
jgi:hypothetical protein